MRKIPALFLALLLMLSAGCGSGADPTPSAEPDGTATPLPTATPTPQPGPTPEAEYRLVAREGDGLLMQKDGLRVLYLSGSPYEMGYQHGALLKNDIVALSEIVETVLEAEQPGQLAAAWEAAEPYIPERYKEEMRGVADGSGVPLETVQRMNLFPELFHCTGIAAYGDATADGELLHVRILDYSVDQKLQDHSVVIVQSPDGYNTFMNAGVAGMIGSVTGMNQEKVTFGEMGGGGEGEWEGVPMTFLMRMGLEQADDLEEALAIFRGSPRTCEYYYVISDAKARDARALYTTPEEYIEVSPGEASELLPAPLPEHVVMVSGEDRYLAALERINENYGKLTPALLMELIKRPVSMKSNLHNAIFKPDALTMWLAVAADPSLADFQACYQTYYEYSLTEIMEKADAFRAQ